MLYVSRSNSSPDNYYLPKLERCFGSGWQNLGRVRNGPAGNGHCINLAKSIKYESSAAANAPAEIIVTTSANSTSRKSHSPDIDSGEVHFAATAQWLRPMFWTTTIIFGLAQCWITRHTMGPDGLSYLEIGQAYARLDWAQTLNAYWSPLYPVLIGIGFLIFRPSVPWHFPVAHLVNFLVLLGAALAFEFFWRGMVDAIWQRDGQSANALPLPKWALWSIGYAVFLWASLVWNGIGQVTPDLAVSAFVYLVAGTLVRLNAQPNDWRWYLLLGICLGFGYLCKTIWFPLGWFALLLVAVGNARSAKRLALTAVASALFVVIALPQLLVIHQLEGHFGYGDNGKLTYAEQVSPKSYHRNWQGEPPGSGTPLHPSRIIFDHPRAYEFAAPGPGTYPLWLNPSYWEAGKKVTFSLRAQLDQIIRGLYSCIDLFTHEPYGMLLGVLALASIGCWRRLPSELLRWWNLGLIALAGIGAYLLVLIGTRYIAGFMAVLWLLMVASLRYDSSERARLAGRIAGMLALTIVFALLLALVRLQYKGPDDDARGQYAVADRLRDIGITPGMRVGDIGEDSGVYWAHFAGLQVMAEIMSQQANEFWTAPQATQQAVMEGFSQAGAVAVIARKPPASAPDPKWQQLGETHYFVFLLAKLPGAAGTPVG